MERIKRLPDCYPKDRDSNHFKVLELTEFDISQLKKDIQIVKDSLDLEYAFGQTLDLYGDMLSQSRGKLNDIQYRYMIKSKIAINNVEGDYNSVLQTMARILHTNEEELEFEDGENPCTFEIRRFPFQVLVDAGFTSRQAVDMVRRLLPIGVVLSAQNFEGTFEFAEYEQEYDSLKGFADLERTIGGFFGLLLGEDYHGTFEFDRYDTVFDASSGFADLEQKIGGYFGTVVDGGIEELPI